MAQAVTGPGKEVEKEFRGRQDGGRFGGSN